MSDLIALMDQAIPQAKVGEDGKTVTLPLAVWWQLVTAIMPMIEYEGGMDS